MEKIKSLAILASVVVVAAGCNKPNPGSPNGDTHSIPANSAGGSASNAWQSAKTAGSNAWQAARSAATNARQDTKAASTNAWEKAKDAFGAGGSTNEISTNYFSNDYSQKDQFVAEARTALDKTDQKISDLSDKVANASDTEKANFQPQMQDLKAKRADLAKKYDDIKNATQDSWNDARTTFETSYYNVKDAIKSDWNSLTNSL